MKGILSFFLILTSMNSFAADIFSDDFRVRVEPNKHTPLEDYRIVVRGEARAYNPRNGDPRYAVLRGKTVIGGKESENTYHVPGFEFNANTQRSFSTTEVEAHVWFENKNRSNDGVPLASSVAYDERKNASGFMNTYFNDIIYVTTVPSFNFKMAGKLKSLDGASSKIDPRNIAVYGLDYQLLDDTGKVITFMNLNRSEVDSDKGEEVLNVNAKERIFATKEKPSSLRIILSSQILKPNGVYEVIRKNFNFCDLDNIDLTSEINELNYEISARK